MNIALTSPDDFWKSAISSARNSSAEDFAFLSIVSGILVAIFFAIIAPQQRMDSGTPAINIRIKAPTPANQHLSEASVEEIVNPRLPPLPVPKDSQAPEENKIAIPQAEEPEKKLDLSLPRILAPIQYRQFGIINKPTRSMFSLRGPENGGNVASSDTYEPYVNAYGDLLVGISDRCTMNLGSSFGLFDSDIQKVARINCKKDTGKKELDIAIRSNSFRNTERY